MGGNSVMHVLWSGGWDSTFRVLDLVLLQKATVQPHYVLALDRVRSPLELQAIQDIRKQVADRDPDAGRRLRPVRIVLAGDLERNPNISAAWHEIRSRRVFSGQYLWLNLYAAQTPETDLEIGFNRDDAEKYRMPSLMVQCRAANGSPSWRLASNHGEHDLSLFERFSFPMIEISKSDMRAIAEKRGFADLMHLTWFCMMPIGNQPCGHCRTCRDSIKVGMIDRFSAVAKFRYRYWRGFHAFYLMRDQPKVFASRLTDLVTGRRP